MNRITPTLTDSLIILRWILTALAAFILIYSMMSILSLREATARNHTIGLQNNTYLRTEACILSVPLATRTGDYIENCYLKAEKATGVQVDHFGQH